MLCDMCCVLCVCVCVLCNSGCTWIGLDWIGIFDGGLCGKFGEFGKGGDIGRYRE